MTSLPGTDRDLNWLITDFADRVPDVARDRGVGGRAADRLLERVPPERAHQLAAVAAGLASLTQGASRIFEGGEVKQTMVDMDRGLLIAMGVNGGSTLAVLVGNSSDMGLVAYEMSLLVVQVGDALTLEVRGAQPPG